MLAKIAVQAVKIFMKGNSILTAGLVKVLQFYIDLYGVLSYRYFIVIYFMQFCYMIFVMFLSRKKVDCIAGKKISDG